MIYALALVLGLITGSAVTALAEDADVRGWMRRRSRCPRCNEVLRFFDLMPIVSFVVLRGRCRYCGDRIPRWHVWTEVCAVGVFLLAVLFRPDLSVQGMMFLFAVLFVLLVLTVTDIRFWTLPDALVGALAVLAFLRLGLSYVADIQLLGMEPSVYSAVLGGVLGLASLGSISLFSGGRAMGWGDGKLTCALGFLLGWELLLIMLAIAFLVGGMVGGALLVAGRATRKSHIPFGPFLVFGAVLVLLFPELSSAVFRFVGMVYY